MTVPEAAPTRALARFVSGTRFEDLPPDAVVAAKRLVLDILGVGVAGWSTATGRIPALTKLQLGGAAQASVLAAGARTSAPAAAYANVALGTALEADDTLCFLGHHGPGVVLPALAVAEAEGANGRALIAAVAVGYEVSGRLAKASVHVRREADGGLSFAPTPGTSYGALAAAAVSASLLGLDEQTTAYALGIAAYGSALPSAGRWIDPPRRNTKYNAYAMMAEAGVTAALLARNGMTGDDAIFDGGLDWFPMTGSMEPDRAALTRNLGEDWLITRLSYKRYPSCRFTHGAVDILLALMAQDDVRPEEIEAIEAHVTSNNFAMKMDSTVIGGEIDCQFSLPYGLAMAALGVTPGPDWMAPALWTDPRVHALMDKVRLHPWPQADRINLEDKLDDRRFRRPTRLKLTARGRTREAEVEYFSGDPWSDATRFGEAEVVAKFHDYAAALAEADRQACVRAVLDLDQLSSVADLARAAGALPGRRQAAA